METGITNYIYKNDHDKHHFQYVMAGFRYKDLTRRIHSDKALRNRVFKIANNLTKDKYQRGLASMFSKFSDKKSPGTGIKSMSNQQLADKLYKPIQLLDNSKKEKLVLHLKVIVEV